MNAQNGWYSAAFVVPLVANENPLALFFHIFGEAFLVPFPVPCCSRFGSVFLRFQRNCLAMFYSSGKRVLPFRVAGAGTFV